jgi:hypothetical protein
MDDTALMRLRERARDLDRQPHGLFDGQRTRERLAVDILQHQIIRPDIENLANVGMIQRRYRPSLLLKSLAMLAVQTLDRDDAPQPRIVRFPHFTHAARPDQRNDLVRTESLACCKGHGC